MDSDISYLVKKVNNSDIASIKGVVNGIFKVINDPESSAKDLEEVIKADPPLAAKVIKRANSAYYSPNPDIESLKEAIIWIGFQEIRDLALTHKLYSIFNGESKQNFSRSGLWKNSLSVAILSRLISRNYFSHKGNDIYTIALLRDLGIIVEDQFLTSDFSEVLSLVNNKSYSFIEAEKEVFGFDHQDVFKKIAQSWKLPDQIKSGVLYHHNPEKAPREYDKIIVSLYIANNYCSSENFGYTDVKKDEDKYQRYLDDLGIKKDSLELLEGRLWDEMQPFLEHGIIDHKPD